MTLYQVIGKMGYCGHQPGDKFDANLDPETEARGIRRRNIRVISRKPTALQPGSYTLPRGWETPTPAKEG